MCITVKCVNQGYCGQILAGTPTAPFSGALEFRLSGDEFTESHQCGGFKGKAFDVHRGAELLLYGQRPQRRWGRLRRPAAKGALRLVMQGVVDWQAGDELLIASSPASPLHLPCISLHLTCISAASRQAGDELLIASSATRSDLPPSPTLLPPSPALSDPPRC